LTLSNCAVFIWLAREEPPANAIQLGFAYLAFELFAAFVSQAAYAAQESHRDALRANRELQAARALVAEGAWPVKTRSTCAVRANTASDDLFSGPERRRRSTPDERLEPARAGLDVKPAQKRDLDPSKSG
jgi:hypothetical protein